jgi:hypothetical protein
VGEGSGNNGAWRYALTATAASATLEEKLAQQKRQRELEGKRSKLRRESYVRQDEIEAQRDALIEQLEGRLGQRVEEKCCSLWSGDWCHLQSLYGDKSWLKFAQILNT